jgi:hypothetical protein
LRTYIQFSDIEGHYIYIYSILHVRHQRSSPLTFKILKHSHWNCIQTINFMGIVGYKLSLRTSRKYIQFRIKCIMAHNHIPNLQLWGNHHQGSSWLSFQVMNKTFIFKLQLDHKIRIHIVNYNFSQKIISLESSEINHKKWNSYLWGLQSNWRSNQESYDSFPFQIKKGSRNMKP